MTGKECIFCRIGGGEIPSDRVHETARIVVFRDLNPKAPVHLLAIPKEHVAELGELDAATAGEFPSAIRVAAEKAGIFSSGYRVVVNQGKDAGQEVEHLHFHVLGGRALAWPPG